MFPRTVVLHNIHFARIRDDHRGTTRRPTGTRPPQSSRTSSRA